MSLQDKILDRYGNPLKSEAEKILFERVFMKLWTIPLEIQQVIPSLGKTTYINKDVILPYKSVLEALISEGLHGEIKSNDGFFNPRYQRGSTTQISMHTWAIGLDLNPDHNPLNCTRDRAVELGLRPFTLKFVQVWRDFGWTPGIDFKHRPDGMHFEYTKHIN